MEAYEIAGRCKEALLGARWLLSRMNDGAAIVQQGVSFGDATADIELAADRALGLYLRKQLREVQGVDTVVVEGLDETEGRGGEFRLYVDPLDGSLNYKTRGMTYGLPYSGCITALRGGSTFANVAAAAVCDYRSGDSWRTNWDGMSYRTSVNGMPARTLSSAELDLGSQIVIGEMYYPENRERLCRAFAGKKGWLRSPGSAAYEMALVASGTAAAFICDRQKQHELGAGYALVKGAGGIAVDFEGRDLGNRTYDFKTQTPVVLAANRAIAEAVLSLLQRQ